MKYLKGAAGVLGAALAIAAQHADFVPDKYRWVLDALVLVATGLGIYHAPYVPTSEKPGDGDAGHADVGCVLVAIACSIVVLAVAVLTGVVK